MIETQFLDLSCSHGENVSDPRPRECCFCALAENDTTICIVAELASAIASLHPTHVPDALRRVSQLVHVSERADSVRCKGQSTMRVKAGYGVFHYSGYVVNTLPNILDPPPNPERLVFDNLNYCANFGGNYRLDTRTRLTHVPQAFVQFAAGALLHIGHQIGRVGAEIRERAAQRDHGVTVMLRARDGGQMQDNEKGVTNRVVEKVSSYRP